MSILKRLKHFAAIAIYGGALCTVLPAGPGRAEAANDAPSLFRIETRKTTRNQLAPGLSYTGYASLRYLGEQDIKRDDEVPDISNRWSAYLGLAARADLGLGAVFFANAELVYDHRSVTGRHYPARTKVYNKELLISLAAGERGRATIGRMRFSDLNKWIADTSVGGVHIGFYEPGQNFEIAAVRGTKHARADYVIAHWARAGAGTKTGAFAILERENGAQRLHLTGYRNHDVSGRFSYQINAAVVGGDAGQGRSAGFAFDVRAIRKLGNGPLNVQLTAGLAAGSRGFVHTGLQSSKTYDGGQTQFHRYGYVFQPELGNLAAGTLALGLRPSRNFSLDLTAHAYVQPSPSQVAPVARIKGRTTGLSGFLGSELSIAGAWRPARKSKLEFGAGRFFPGSAYRDRSPAGRVYIKYTVYF
ncbi:alginate export family protein (plasmid) [Roseobacteraceae bacterium NS-SX3]